jgi:hypothetical protein
MAAAWAARLFLDRLAVDDAVRLTLSIPCAISQRRFSIKLQASFRILKQHIPTDIESPAQPNQKRKGAAKVPGFEHLQITGSDTGLFGQSFLGQTGGSAQPAKIASKNIELFLRDALHAQTQS